MRRRTLALAIATAPVIYAMAVPIALLDLSVSAYQAICFSAWGVQRVRRSDYLLIDRHRLAYLNPAQKAHCVYCGYANGVLAYAVEIAARTEQFWCPIQHAKEPPRPHGRYGGFAPYGDKWAFSERRELLRDELVGPAEPALVSGVTAVDHQL